MKTFRREVDSTLRIMLFAIICLIVSAIVLPKSGGPRHAREAATRLQIETFRAAIEAYKVDDGDYPSGPDALESLLRAPTNAARWRGPYLKHEKVIPYDPWGTPYRYDFPGHHGTNAFDVFSAGPDRMFGTEDDIGNWPAP